MRRLTLGAVFLFGSGLFATSADATPLSVAVEYQAFAPTALDALPGDSITWNNSSGRTHTVTADRGEFDSGPLESGGQFSLSFATVGVHPYHCAIHAGMVGEVDVRRVTLDPLPTGLLAVGASVEMSGRTAQPTLPVDIEQDSDGRFRTIATATPGPDGNWKTRVRARQTATYRAVAGEDTSEARRLLVANRAVRIKRTRHGLSVTVVPAAPYGSVMLQLRLRNRFGWWPVARRQLDYLSQTRFSIRGHAIARVALLAADGWTALALSRVVAT